MIILILNKVRLDFKAVCIKIREKNKFSYSVKKMIKIDTFG